ncbi:MAG: recombinase family protein [Eubacteriales bacterium]
MSTISRDDEMQGDSNSIKNQKMILEKYAKEKGFKNLTFFVDDGFSGSNFDRPDWKRLIEQVEQGNVSQCIVKDISRVGRDYLRVGMYTEMLFPEKNVRFIAIGNDIDSFSQRDNDFTPFINILNEFQVRDTSKKIRQVFKARGLEGRHVSPSVPYGYLRDPNNKENWVVDQVAAEVIRRIYRLVIEGNGVYQIAKILSDDKVLIPSAHWKKIKADNLRSTKYKDEFAWSGGVISRIIQREEYLGHTVSFKTHNLSYKVKKAVQVPKEERLIFENTHEPIIDLETWKNAQRLRKTVRKPNKQGEVARLTGILFCADCGAKLTHDRSINYSGKRQDRNNYFCSNYRNYSKDCTHHYIRTSVVEMIILNALRETSAFARNNKEEFIELVMNNQDIQQEKDMGLQKKKLTKLRKRYNELDNLIRKIYEDTVSGKLSDKRFEKLSADYETEQETVEGQIKILEEEIERLSSKKSDTSKFLNLINKYTNFDELTTVMINEFIEKIVVHERVKGYRYKTLQDIDVYFNFIGKITLSSNVRENSTENREIKPKVISTYSQKRFHNFVEYMNAQTDSLIHLSLKDIENILGHELSRTYYDHRTYWYPHKHRPIGNIIYNAGYDIQKLDLKNQRITLFKLQT